MRFALNFDIINANFNNSFRIFHLGVPKPSVSSEETASYHIGNGDARLYQNVNDEGVDNGTEDSKVLQPISPLSPLNAFEIMPVESASDDEQTSCSTADIEHEQDQPSAEITSVMPEMCTESVGNNQPNCDVVDSETVPNSEDQGEPSEQSRPQIRKAIFRKCVRKGRKVVRKAVKFINNYAHFKSVSLVNHIAFGTVLMRK